MGQLSLNEQHHGSSALNTTYNVTSTCDAYVPKRLVEVVMQQTFRHTESLHTKIIIIAVDSTM